LTLLLCSSPFCRSPYRWRLLANLRLLLFLYWIQILLYCWYALVFGRDIFRIMFYDMYCSKHDKKYRCVTWAKHVSLRWKPLMVCVCVLFTIGVFELALVSFCNAIVQGGIYDWKITTPSDPYYLSQIRMYQTHFSARYISTI
jgi:hypothetical protein